MHHAYGTDFFAGDEDNGEQGAWYVLAALGLFSATPGTYACVRVRMRSFVFGGSF